ncbi:MAG: carboxy terminal-processing peptidase [Chlorobiaceae bacterium]|nr:carboxy terminal-processing peptidase [Chlorobiaceae bacterium]
MFKKSLLLVFFILGSTPTAFIYTRGAAATVSGNAILRPTALEEEAGRYITRNLLQNHLRKLSINDSLSREIFNRYLESLDADKSFFTAVEVNNLRRLYANRIDDDFLAGKADAGFSIYNFFLKRAREKMQFMKALADTVNFHFSQPETFGIDRRTAPWPSDRRQLVDLWRKELKYQWLNQKYSGESIASVRAGLAKNISNRLNLLNRQTPEDAFQAYINAIATSFDPHTSYFSPDEYDNFQIDMSRSLEGIGAKLQTENDYTVVNEVIPGGPAFRGKILKKGDKIIAVAQGNAGEFVDVTGWRINDVVKLIRGRKGSLVRLQIFPASQGGRGPVKIVQIVRDKINLEEQAAQKSVIMQGGKKIGIITIPSFYLDFEGQQKNSASYNSTTRDVSRILGELVAEHVDGVVVDLRENGGGSLEEAVNVTGLFIPSGPVVQVSNSTGGKMVLRDDDRRVQYAGPLAVLVNRYSASASEIFAAAIQDYRRGVIIGERTFGKGTVQSLIKLARPVSLFGKPADLGELKLTIAKFYRVSGGSTQHKGVVPDITMPSMIDTTTIGEDTYSSSLPWNSISRSFFQPIGDVTTEDIAMLRLKFRERTAKNREYQSYLHDLGVLEKIRRKKAVSLQETVFRSETESIKQIEKQWLHEPDSTRNPGRDVILNQSAAVVNDLSNIKAVHSQTVIRTIPSLN